MDHEKVQHDRRTPSTASILRKSLDRVGFLIQDVFMVWSLEKTIGVICSADGGAVETGLRHIPRFAAFVGPSGTSRRTLRPQLGLLQVNGWAGGRTESDNILQLAGIF